MNKIPTMFERDFAIGSPTRYRILDKPRHGCEWVFAGEGSATRKIDGTCCLVRAGKLFKRRELREDEPPPSGFEETQADEDTHKRVGWVPVGDGAEDKWHRDAFAAQPWLLDGTYELIGPKIQGNPEGFAEHVLVSHQRTGEHLDAPRTFAGLRDWLQGMDIEGIVFHHPDGRMAKIKKRDFGLKRK